MVRPMPSIPIFEGSNVVGRSNLVVVDKRVSRKHLSLRASADSSVEVVVVSLQEECCCVLMSSDRKSVV